MGVRTLTDINTQAARIQTATDKCYDMLEFQGITGTGKMKDIAGYIYGGDDTLYAELVSGGSTSSPLVTDIGLQAGDQISYKISVPEISSGQIIPFGFYYNNTHGIIVMDYYNSSESDQMEYVCSLDVTPRYSLTSCNYGAGLRICDSLFVPAGDSLSGSYTIYNSETPLPATMVSYGTYWYADTNQYLNSCYLSLFTVDNYLNIETVAATKIYYIKIMRNGSIVHYLRPVLNSQSFVDTVTGTEYIMDGDSIITGYDE